MVSSIDIDSSVLAIVDAETAWRYRAVPVEMQGTSAKFLVVANSDQNEIVEELEFITGKKIFTESVAQSVITELLAKHYRRSSNGSDKPSFRFTNAQSFLEDMVQEARNLGSSDIHLEPYKNGSRIRIRIDGKLIEKYKVEATEYPGMVNKLKIKSNLDIAEKRLPQDGRISFGAGEDMFDIRVSVLPTMYGEKVVLRLLNQDATNIDINSLGFSGQDLEAYLMCVRKPHGIVLISGPTGSGKTTTLYATLKLLNKKEVNICTIEDPIEYTLEGVNQVQVKEKIGLSFASGLRSFLRQDPDIIMLGEIRDSETANMAIRASLTGHLVLSTIHTNSAVDTIFRLQDMGVPMFLVANTMTLSAAQRLVRLLCSSCKTREAINVKLPQDLKPLPQDGQCYAAMGCEDCYYTGYKGRTAIYEILPIRDDLRQKIKANQIDRGEIEDQIGSLRQRAWQLVLDGKTSVEEVYPILIA